MMLTAYLMYMIEYFMSIIEDGMVCISDNMKRGFDKGGNVVKWNGLCKPWIGEQLRSPTTTTYLKSQFIFYFFLFK